jgi:hypothetical protein
MEPLWAQRKTESQIRTVCERLGVDHHGMSRREMIEHCSLLNAYNKMTRDDLESNCSRDQTKSKQFISQASDEQLVKCIVDNPRINWKKELAKFRRDLKITSLDRIASTLNKLEKRIDGEDLPEFRKEKNEYLKKYREQEKDLESFYKKLPLKKRELESVRRLAKHISEHMVNEVKSGINDMKSLQSGFVSKEEPQKTSNSWFGSFYRAIDSVIGIASWTASKLWKMVSWSYTILNWIPYFLILTPGFTKMILFVIMELKKEFCIRLADMGGWLRVSPSTGVTDIEIILDPEIRRLRTEQEAHDYFDSPDFKIINSIFNITRERVTDWLITSMNIILTAAPAFIRFAIQIVSFLPGVGFLGRAMGRIGKFYENQKEEWGLKSKFSQTANWLSGWMVHVLVEFMGFGSQIFVWTNYSWMAFLLLLDVIDPRACTSAYDKLAWRVNDVMAFLERLPKK